MLEIGSTAPDIELEDTAGRAVRLADYRGSDNVLLYFMRSTSCAICGSHVKDLARHAAELTAAGVRVLIAVPEGRSEAAAWKAKRGLPFQVVTGQSGTPHEAVGLMRKVFGSMQQSGSLLIDRDGVVRHAHGATVPVNSYDKKGITKAVTELPAGA
ncbi:peroxiredoxin family protein [Allokutzneria sp. A3M-2-11 16]|uniref:peroxiredoxin family protein n=1 Tax=Allokutzneria sp. A3M-2-11 16 TaxID=2962043 RepID=UPI0020B8EBAB|nr:peroxiredoxin family protein [Allokutzneria sp. A3M-2-11 16]MCP3803186.1 peroxiredoxin family protein [Allokutzneria sp. A3M-2-11 16]